MTFNSKKIKYEGQIRIGVWKTIEQKHVQFKNLFKYKEDASQAFRPRIEPVPTKISDQESKIMVLKIINNTSTL